MGAFVIWEQTSTTNRERLETYRKEIHATFAQYGGKLLGGGIPRR
jgi:uncharacterized protein (DUF1330 family)